MPNYTVEKALSSDTEKELLAYSPLLRQLLSARGLTTKELAEAFLAPDYEKHSHNPFLMKDMEKTVERILRAIKSNERIAIFSDYDADGIPGAVVLHDFFKKIGYTNFENYIPDRHDEGFGLNHGAIEQLSGSGTKLLITIDCGITDTLEVVRANELGVDVIITDHHLPLRSPSPLTKGEKRILGVSQDLERSVCGESERCTASVRSAESAAGVVSPLRKETLNNPPAEDGSAPFIKGDTTLPESEFGTPFAKGDLTEQLPPAHAILNPKQSDCMYPEKMLCGSGVVFKLVQALCFRIRSDVPCSMFSAPSLGWEKWLLDMVGLATLSDMVPLTGENRMLAHFGLRVLRKSPRKGLQELLSVLRVNRRELTEDDIGFSISPRINAASRMGVPMDAFRLLITADNAEATLLATHLEKINNERKSKVASLVKEVRKTVEERGARKVVVAGNPNWRPALLGLVANSIAEDLRCPVFLWGREESIELKGSCRSGGSVDLSLLMHEASSVFSDFGGHKEAGGFSTTLEKVHLLEAEIERAYEKVRETRGPERLPTADAVLSLDDINVTTYTDIQKLAPYGIGNPKPIFLFENVTVRRIELFGKEKQHLKLVFAKLNGVYVSAIHFYAKPSDFTGEVSEGKPLNLLAHIEQSTFGNRIELRLRIVDIV